MLKVHGVHGSPFVRKVLITLELKGLEYGMVTQMPFSGDENYKKLNPLGKIPTLVDGNLIVGDSKVICRYLESAYPDVPFYPAGLADKAMADWYDDFASGPVAELAAGIFFQRFMRPRAFKQDPDEALITNIIDKKLPPLLNYIEGQLPSEGYVFGAFSIADLTLVTPFVNAAYAGYEVCGNTYPKFASLIKAVKAEPAVATILAKEAKALGFG
jgi:glutathione S-transferase